MAVPYRLHTLKLTEHCPQPSPARERFIWGGFVRYCEYGFYEHKPAI